MASEKEMLINHNCDFVLQPGDDDPTKAKCSMCGKGIVDDYVPPEPEEEKPLEFTKYRSIQNSYIEKAVQAVQEQGLDSYSWVATNKLHGANFSVMVSAEEVIPCKRSGPILDDETFYNFRPMFSYLKKIMIEMQSYFGKNIQVYFELFGGSYKHPDVPKDPNASMIQKGVFYCPFIDIRVLDIKVQDTFLDFDEMVEVTERHGLVSAKVIARGSFHELIKMNPEFEDPTYKDYNLPKIENNFSEGYVLRPTKELSFGNGERCILKNKSERFLEKSKERKEPKQPVVLDENCQVAYDNLLACVTEARLDNILSHGDVYTKKDFGKLMAAFISDIMKEEGNQDYMTILDKEQRKKITKMIQSEVADLIRPAFLGIVQTF